MNWFFGSFVKLICGLRLFCFRRKSRYCFCIYGFSVFLSVFFGVFFSFLCICWNKFFLLMLGNRLMWSLILGCFFSFLMINWLQWRMVGFDKLKWVNSMFIICVMIGLFFLFRMLMVVFLRDSFWSVFCLINGFEDVIGIFVGKSFVMVWLVVFVYV